MDIPRDSRIDSTFSMMREGYEFIWNRCQKYKSNIFLTRVMGKEAVCIHGPEAAAELFYDESKMQRGSAIPRRVMTSLFGKNAIQTLDDEEHLHRKAAFLKLMTPDALEELMTLTAGEWRSAIRTRWLKDDKPLVLFDEVARILTKATSEWTGVRIKDPKEVDERAADFIAMVDAFGGVGPRLWRGKLARMRAERWMKRHIERVRKANGNGKKTSASGEENDANALHVMANFRDPRDGKLLDAHTAAVEVLNLIRPTVAIAWYVTFAALAMHQHPECRAELLSRRSGSDDYRDLFVQEVRRYFPFAPYLGAKARVDFEWSGHHFKKGTLVLLDIYGANHDPKLWSSPNIFRPERFRNKTPSPYDFIPQGGGLREGHRCPGEWITMHNIALALHFLTHCITYEVPQRQDLSFDLARMPTRPRSGFLIRNVHLVVPAIDAAPPRAPSRIAAHDASNAQASVISTGGVNGASVITL